MPDRELDMQPKPACANCSFLMDLQAFHAMHPIPDGVPFRCVKEGKYEAGQWPPAIPDPVTCVCQNYAIRQPQRQRWEWDETKNRANVEKHRFSFDDATKALEADPRTIRITSPPNKWERLEGLDFEGLKVRRTQANLDPVRDRYLFSVDGSVWVLISTLRGELGLLTERVISVHRASPSEEALYASGLTSSGVHAPAEAPRTDAHGNGTA